MDLERLAREARSSETLKAAAESPEGKRLAKQLDEAKLRDAMQRGDAAALKKLLAAALATPEGKSLAEQVQKAVRKK